MVRFRKQFNGYEKKQVDEYIHKNTEFNESKIRELENCLERLKTENDYLYAKNTEYRRNEERVSGAIIKAMELKNTLENEWKAKLRAEEDRLLLFKEKWVSYMQGIDKCHADSVADDIDEYIRLFRDSFIKRADRDLSTQIPAEIKSPAEESYLQEQKRLQNLREESENKKMSAASLLEDTGETLTLNDHNGFTED